MTLPYAIDLTDPVLEVVEEWAKTYHSRHDRIVLGRNNKSIAMP